MYNNDTARGSSRAQFQRRLLAWQPAQGQVTLRLLPLITVAAVCIGYLVTRQLTASVVMDTGARVKITLVIAVMVGLVLACATYYSTDLLDVWQANRAADDTLTARQLRRLERRGWRVLRDRMVPGHAFTMNHVIIGPGGVFYVDSENRTVEDRLRRGAYRALRRGDWRRDRDLALLVQEASTAAGSFTRSLGSPVTVQAVVSVDDSRLAAEPAILGPITVVPAQRLVHWATRHPRVLDEGEIERLAYHAETALPRSYYARPEGSHR